MLLWRRYIPLEGRVSVTDQEMCNLRRLGRHGRKVVSPDIDEQVKLQRNVIVGSTSTALHKWTWRIRRTGRTIEERAPMKSEEYLYKLNDMQLTSS